MCSDIPEWLQELRENLVDDRVPEHRDSHASSSREPSLEPTPTRSVDLGKHSVDTHFPEDRNCEICQRTKITRAPCRRRNGEAVPRAVNFGDLITADHKVLNESWWADSMECYTYLRNVTDLLSDGKTPYERRFGQPFKGPIIPFGSLVEYHPITAKDQSRIHPSIRKKVLPGLFLGYALYAG